MLGKATLIGRVGHKDSKILKNGGEITTLAIATNKKFTDSTGNKKEMTTWHNVNCFGKLSDVAAKYIQVGALIYVEGDIQNKKIESGERAGQYVYSIHANEIKFINTASNKENSEEKQKSNNKQNNSYFDDDAIPF